MPRCYSLNIDVNHIMNQVTRNPLKAGFKYIIELVKGYEQLR